MKLTERKILLNPGPATTTESVKNAMVVSDICPREKDFGDLTLEICKDLKKIIHADNGHETILIPGSGTYAVEATLLATPDANKVKKSKILLLINGAYGQRMKQICDVHSIAYYDLHFDYCQPIDTELVENFLKDRVDEIFSVAFVHHETTTGVINPLNAISHMLRKYDVLSIVDCMSSFAGVEINIQNEPMDYCITSSNKCLQGMPGIGIIIASTKALNTIKNLPKRSFSLDLYSHFANLYENGQFLFTPCVQVVYSLKQAINELFLEGVKERCQRYQSLYNLMLKGMLELGFLPIVERKFHSGILTTFELKRNETVIDFNQLHDYLYQHGVTIYPGKIANLGKETFRIANIGDLKLSDINYFLKLLSTYLK